VKQRFSGLLLACCLSLLFLSGCNSGLLTRSVPAEEQAQLFIAPTFLASDGSGNAQNPNQPGAPTPTASCSDGLLWQNDLSIPDGSQVAPGSVLDKQWQVKNSGTCNWDERYTLRLTAGVDMGAVSPQLLVPARGGSEAVVQITFTAPAEAGRYRSAWQAYNPDGLPFGDPIYIEIVVTTP
jgi:hypothetical protein